MWQISDRYITTNQIILSITDNLSRMTITTHSLDNMKVCKLATQETLFLVNLPTTSHNLIPTTKEVFTRSKEYSSQTDFQTKICICITSSHQQISTTRHQIERTALELSKIILQWIRAQNSKLSSHITLHHKTNQYKCRRRSMHTLKLSILHPAPPTTPSNRSVVSPWEKQNLPPLIHSLIIWAAPLIRFSNRRWLIEFQGIRGRKKGCLHRRI